MAYILHVTDSRNPLSPSQTEHLTSGDAWGKVAEILSQMPTDDLTAYYEALGRADSVEYLGRLKFQGVEFTVSKRDGDRRRYR